MRPHASVLHLDLDAFFAAVEQRDKPSLRGKPVVVGGVGPRGVVATASYEARAFGIRSAMSTAEARSRCPNAAFLTGRFHVYRESSQAVMDLLRSISPLVEPLSLDEAFVDLAESDDFTPEAAPDIAAEIRNAIPTVTNGLTASGGLGSSKLIAKIASEIDKPNGLHIVPAGSEQEFLDPRPVKVIPGVGPVTAARLQQIGLTTIAQVRALEVKELTSILGQASGSALYRLVRGQDSRRVSPHRDAKSVSVEDTFAQDIADTSQLAAIADKQARHIATRLAKHGLSARTVTIKARFHNFETLNRSTTLLGPTDDPGTISKTARSLLNNIDARAGFRLLGVGVSGLSDWVQEAFDFDDEAEEPLPEVILPGPRATYAPGADVIHSTHGPGWVWGAGRGVVTVRFETRETPPGPVKSFKVDDPDLALAPRDTVES